MAVRLSIIVCTRNRTEQLRGLLEALTTTLHELRDVEVVLADNGDVAATERLVEAFAEKLTIRHVAIREIGKGHCLHQTTDPKQIGELVAVLDDDMRPHPDWARSLLSVSEAHPDCDLFGGYVYPLWPDASPPAWAVEMPSDLLGWTFSAQGYADQPPERTYPQPRGYWPSGNHHWFRRRLLEQGLQFQAKEPDSAYEFILDAHEAGFTGVNTTKVVAGHALQRELVDPVLLASRARHYGSMYAQRRLRPFRRCVRAARLMHDRPLLGRIFCVGRWLRFRLQLPLARLIPGSRSIQRQLEARERSAYYAAVLHHVQVDPGYPGVLGK